MLSNKLYKKYGDIWGELFRFHRRRARLFRALDIYGKRPKNNTSYYRFTFYVGRFGMVRRRKTRYGKAFIDKQKLKLFYGWLPEAQFRAKWLNSLKHRSHAMFHFFHSLESRLDNLLIRSNYAYNVRQARLLVARGVVVVNGRVLTDYAYTLRPFDVLSIRIAPRLSQFLRRLVRRRYKLLPLPSYLEVNYAIGVMVYTGVNSMPYYPFAVDAGRLRYIYH